MPQYILTPRCRTGRCCGVGEITLGNLFCALKVKAGKTGGGLLPTLLSGEWALPAEDNAGPDPKGKTGQNRNT